jgi:hypothetical protein
MGGVAEGDGSLSDENRRHRNDLKLRAARAPAQTTFSFDINMAQFSEAQNAPVSA